MLSRKLDCNCFGAAHLTFIDVSRNKRGSLCLLGVPSKDPLHKALSFCMELVVFLRISGARIICFGFSSSLIKFPRPTPYWDLVVFDLTDAMPCMVCGMEPLRVGCHNSAPYISLGVGLVHLIYERLTIRDCRSVPIHFKSISILSIFCSKRIILVGIRVFKPFYSKLGVLRG